MSSSLWLPSINVVDAEVRAALQKALEAEIQFAEEDGLTYLGEYEAGLVINNTTDFISYNYLLLRTRTGVVLPYAITGNWALDSLNLEFLSTDDQLRADLLATTGATNVFLGERSLFDKAEDEKSFLDVLTEAELLDVNSFGFTVNLTAKANQFLLDYPSTEFPVGGYLVDYLSIPASARTIRGRGKNGAVFRRSSGATGSFFRWNGTTRIMNAEIGGIYAEGNGLAGETHGVDFSGFSYCTFRDMRMRLFNGHGFFADGAITPVNKQVSNNLMLNLTGNNNEGDGCQFTGSSPQRFENTACLMLGCEFAGNGGAGLNLDVAESTQSLGGTYQGNVGKDVRVNSRYNIITGYVEGNPKPVLFDTQSYGCDIKLRSAYPLWNTYVDNGIGNRKSIFGEVLPEVPLFINPHFTDWVGTLPAGLTLNGTPTVASVADTGSFYGADLRLTLGANFQGIIFSLLQSGAQLAGRWVTLQVVINTSGVVDPLEHRLYARDGVTLNSASGEFLTDNLQISGSGRHIVLSMDVKFPAAIAGTPTLLWYIAYNGVSAGGNIVDIRSAKIVLGQTSEVSPMPPDTTRPIAASQAQITAIGGGINIHRKFQGKMVYNSTNGKIYFALNTATNSAWRATDGSGDLTPV